MQRFVDRQGLQTSNFFLASKTSSSILFQIYEKSCIRGVHLSSTMSQIRLFELLISFAVFEFDVGVWMFWALISEHLLTYEWEKITPCLLDGPFSNRRNWYNAWCSLDRILGDRPNEARSYFSPPSRQMAGPEFKCFM